jgi:hypothetical protein
MLSGSTGLITTIFKCPSMKPCGAALMDAVLASIRKMQATAMEDRTDDIRIKRQDGIVSSSLEFTGNAKTKEGRRRRPSLQINRLRLMPA